MLARDFFARSFSTSASTQSEYKDVHVEDTASLMEGEMREVSFGEESSDKFLLVRYEGKLRAVGSFCSHFSAPLKNGVLFDDKVLCPAHCMGFSVVTGYPE